MMSENSLKDHATMKLISTLPSIPVTELKKMSAIEVYLQATQDMKMKVYSLQKALDEEAKT